MAIVGFDPTLLLNYYAAKAPVTASSGSTARAGSSVVPPWDYSIKKPAQELEDVSARSTDPYFDPKDTSLLSKNGGAQNSGSQLEALLKSELSNPSSSANSALSADNNKLFALYKALDRLNYIAQMGTRDGTVAGQLAGLDKNFQDGMAQVQSFLKSATFDNLTVMAGAKTASTQSSAAIAYAQSEYIGGPVVKDADVFKPVSGVSATDQFTVSVTKGGVKTDVAIDLSNISGPLTLDNIDAYVNSQLSAQGFGTRFTRTQTGGSIVDGTATWGIKVNNVPSESISMSSPQAKAAVYVAGASGTPTDSEGKLVKLTGLDGTPSSVFNANIAPDSGVASAKATVTDAQGNVYVVGNSTGSFGSEINQGSQDVFLTKYDSAGNVQWTKLLGSADSASGFSIAADPSSGGVVIAGSATGDLSTSSIGGGTDSFVAKYDSEGNQKWLRQVAPGSSDQANGVSVDASGNVYVGGQVNGSIGSSQVNSGGQDAYLTKLDNKGNLVFERQFGSSGTDAATHTAVAADGNIVVASVQNGHAILTKYSSADNSSSAMWQMDLGDLKGGSLGGLTVSGNNVYLSGTTSNASLDAGGAATVAHANSGGTDAFVFAATDSGASANANFVSYVGTGSSEQGGGVAVANGNIYLTGTTTGTFAGQTRSGDGTHNMFVAQLDSGGAVGWTQQYGGLDGQSQGFAIAADASGSSVLDALKLPRGTIDLNQSNAIELQTTVRAGDYFSLQVTDTSGTRTVKVTISKGETLRSLAVKINGALLFDGKATTLGISGGQGLKIGVNAGVQVQLIPGSKDFDALAGLGISPQTLTNDGTSGNTSSSGNTTAPATTSQTIGLAINGGINLLDKTAAAHAHVVLLGAMAQIKQAYTKLNAPPSTSTASSAGNGTVPAYLQSQLAGYQTALAWLNTINGSTGTTSLTG